MRIYLDACSLSRLTDDQSQARVREEAEAVEQFFRLVRAGRVKWISSNALLAEVARNPDSERRRDAEILLLLASETISIDASMIERARQFELAGYGAFDALHLSVAEAGRADVLLSTDDRFVSRAGRGLASPRIRVLNPLKWSTETVR